MAGLNVGLTSALGVASNLLQTVILKSGRSIGAIIPDVTIEEDGTDEIEITKHPVEDTAAVTDHAFRMPAQLTMRVGWSDASNSLLSLTTLGGLQDIASSALNSLIGGGGGASAYLKGIYDNLLTLQQSFQPITVVTGKRVYNNMLIRSIRVSTTKETENALIVTCVFQEIILVTTQQATMTSMLQSTPDQQTNSLLTAAPANTGAKQVIPAPQSALTQIQSDNW